MRAFVIVLITFLCYYKAYAFEENSRFCLHTEKTLISNQQHRNPFRGNHACEISATILDANEKENFKNIICKKSSNDSDYYYLKLRNGELTGYDSHHNYCDGKHEPLFAWIPYESIQLNYAKELHPKEQNVYLAGAFDKATQKSELCHFRQIDLVSNIGGNLSTCTAMTFRNNYYGLQHNIHVLVEIQPIIYEIRNINYVPWVNASKTYKTIVGKSVLENRNHDRKFIYGSLKYEFVEEVILDLDSVYNNTSEKLPLLFEHKDGTILELHSDGIGGVDIKEITYFGRIMDANSAVNVEIVGQWLELHKKFTADIYEYFGYGVKRFSHSLQHGAATFMRIGSTEPVYEKPESKLLQKATPYVELNKIDEPVEKFERLSNAQSLNVKLNHEDTNVKSGGRIYPGLLPWAIASGVALAAALIFVAVTMLRYYCSNSSKHKYMQTNA